jgi:hypothetical protein
VAAWREVAGVSGEVAAETLGGGRHSAAVRLRVGARGTLVAKLRPRGELDLERVVHERVLPGLRVPVPACLGFASGRGDEDDVLFLEDVGDRRFEPADPTHRDAAGDWLGRCHAASLRARIPARVPRRSSGPERLLGVRRALAGVRDNPALGEAGARGVGRVLELLAAAEQRWSEWGPELASVPPVLTHGAFVTRNVRVRGETGAIELLPFDWDHVAVGSPAIDLARTPRGSRGFAANASLERYRIAAAERGLALRTETVGALAVAGSLIRAAACIGWLVPTLEGSGARHALRELEIYREALDAALAQGVPSD